MMQLLARYATEAVIGLALAALVVLALVASVSVVPFIYAGF